MLGTSRLFNFQEQTGFPFSQALWEKASHPSRWTLAMQGNKGHLGPGFLNASKELFTRE